MAPILMFLWSPGPYPTKSLCGQALLYTAMSETEMEHFDHGSFNFNLDLAYPAKACFSRSLWLLRCFGVALSLACAQQFSFPKPQTKCPKPPASKVVR